MMIETSRLMTKPAKWHVHPAKTQISLGIRPVWSESSLCVQWVAKDPSFLHADTPLSPNMDLNQLLICCVSSVIIEWGFYILYET